MANRTVYGGGEESSAQRVTKTRKALTEAGYPEVARKADSTWDTEQSVKTMDAMREVGYRRADSGRYDREEK